MAATAARAYFGLGVAMIALHLAVGGSLAIYETLGLTSGGMILIAIAWYRPANWRGWASIGLSQVLFASGDFAFHQYPPATFPALPDALYLASYVALIGGLLGLMGRSFAWRDVAGHLDALLVTVALGLAGWMLFLDGHFQLRFDRAQIVAISYPFFDLICLGLLIRIALAPGRRNVAYWLLLVAVLPLFLSDGTYVVPALGASYHLGSWLDAGWFASYVLLGTAALHPSMGDIAGTAQGARRPPLALRRVVAGGIALLSLPLAAVVEDVTRGGADILLFALGMAIVLAGMLYRAILIVRELDALRVRSEVSERKFRMVFDKAPIGISVGRDGIMAETNPAFQRMLGYTGAELAQMHYTDITHPDDRSLAEQAELEAGSRDAFTATKHYVRKDGTSADSRVHVVLDLDDGLGMSLVEDITGQHALEEQLREAQKMEAIGKLAGGIAHDFNNLMTAVIGYSDLLLRRGDPATRDKLEAIRQSAVRASDLTRQLLAFSRRQLLQLDELDLREVLHALEPLLRHSLDETTALEIVYWPEPVLIRADVEQLERVVVNLVVNANAALPDGGTVTVTVLADAVGAVLTVSDDGVGMDEDTRARIFEPFFTTKTLGESSGLGLSTVHGIVGQSGGTIEVDSAVGRGSVFTVRLPAVVAQATLVD